MLEESPSKLVRGSFPIEFTPPFVTLSCASQCSGLYGSKELVYFAANLMTDREMARKLPRLHLVQMHLEPGARLVLTLQTVRSSLQSEGLLGAQCHLHMLGPFGKVPDRVTGAIFHALVQCVAPRGSQLYQNQNPICQLIAGAFVFCSPPAGFVGHVFAGFSLGTKFLGGLYLFSEPTFTKSHSGACELS